MDSEKETICENGTATANSEPFRSGNLMNSFDTALLVIDFQEKLYSKVLHFERVQWNICRLIEGAAILGVCVVATEQYPQGLGNTVAAVQSALKTSGADPVSQKTMFSCRECVTQFDQLRQSGIEKILLCGIETHVCVAQTGFDLMSAGFAVYVCVDAVSSRNQIDHDTAIRRLENSGATVTTTEAALFEWCERSGSDSFKKISKLVRETGPAHQATP